MAKSTDNRADTMKKAGKNLDGLANVYTREGVAGYDKNLGYSYSTGVTLTEQQDRAIYRSDGFARKIVDRPTEDMVRNWFDVTGDTDGVINKALAEINTKQAFRRALTWAQVFGGSAILIVAKDGKEMSEELDEKALTGISELRVYDRFRITWTSTDEYTDPALPKFGMPEKYLISPRGGKPFTVHETRLIRFEGVMTDDDTLEKNSGWPDSIYQAVLNHLTNLTSSYNATKSIMDDFIQIIVQIDNLQDLIAAGQDDLVKQRLNLIDLGRHTMNTILLDGTENYTKEASSVSGIEKLIQEFQLAVSAITDIPLVILMGRSPGGLNSTGESDIRMYYDSISSRQEDEMLTPANRLVKLTMLSKEGPTKGAEIKDWAVVFNPLWQPSEKEIAETRKTQSDSDVAYIQAGVVTPQEVAVSRFSGEYSLETTIDTAAKREAQAPLDSNVDGFELSGKTAATMDHAHDFVIFDKVSGNGWTDEAGDDMHAHRIEAYTVQPKANREGVSHLHMLPKAGE